MNRQKAVVSALLFSLFGLFSVSASAEVKPPTFRAETIDSKVVIGYGTAIGDVDGDGKPDILLADKKQFVWYKNPDWTRHIIAENLTDRDNVCIAARDIDGDGKVEIAVGGQWNPGDTVNSGSVHYLIPPNDRTKMWTPVKLHHEPVVHRMRWLKLGEKQFALVVAPLHGRGNKGGQGAGAKLLAYHVPNDVRAEWRTQLLDDKFHVTHNFDPGQWNPSSEAEEILYLGREGAALIEFENGKWTRRPFKDVQGGGEIRMGILSKSAQFIATIEPFHGSSLVFYRSAVNRGSANGKITEIAERIVLDANFVQGHAIATGDLLGSGSQQIVAGWRNPNRAGKVGVKLYYPTDAEAKKWDSVVVDDNKMACEDLRIGDLNGDGRPDIVAAGRATHNLKIYWNLGSE
ncbi:MAG: FG-GAP-like repeat-containing protein [Pirellulales bacterium]